MARAVSLGSDLGGGCFRLFGIDDSYVKQGSGVLRIYFQCLLVFLERGRKMPFPEVAGAEVAEESAVLRAELFGRVQVPDGSVQVAKPAVGETSVEVGREHPLS